MVNPHSSANGSTVADTGSALTASTATARNSENQSDNLFGKDNAPHLNLPSPPTASNPPHAFAPTADGHDRPTDIPLRVNNARKSSASSYKRAINTLKSEHRNRFKLIDTTFDKMPLAKTLLTVQILTKLGNRVLKHAKQDSAIQESARTAGKLVFSPFVVQAYAPQKSQIKPVLEDAADYEKIPELVDLLGAKQAGNLLLAGTYFYNTAITWKSLKMKLAAMDKREGPNISSSTPPSAPEAEEISTIRKLIKRLYAHLKSQFPILLTVFDKTSAEGESHMTSDTVNSHFLLFSIFNIAKHDIIKERNTSGRIDLVKLQDLVRQVRSELASNKKDMTSARARHLRNPGLNSVVHVFTSSYIQMERHWLREGRVNARRYILNKLICVVMLVKFKLPGCSAKFRERVPTDIASHESPNSQAGEIDTLHNWFEDVPKTELADRMKLQGFEDTLVGGDQGFPIPMLSFTELFDTQCRIPRRTSNKNKEIILQYRRAHPEFKVTFRFRKFVVAGPSAHDVFATTSFRDAATVPFSYTVNFLSIAQTYLSQLLGCQNTDELFALHTNAALVIVSFARTMLLVTKDYLGEHIAGGEDEPETKDKKHMQMFSVTTSKKVNPVEEGNVSAMFGLKSELPPAPLSERPENCDIVGQFPKFFDSISQKAIATKILLSRRDYDHGTGDVADASEEENVEDSVDVNEDEPVTKKVRLTFDSDSDSDLSA